MRSREDCEEVLYEENRKNGITHDTETIIDSLPTEEQYGNSYVPTLLVKRVGVVVMKIWAKEKTNLVRIEIRTKKPTVKTKIIVMYFNNRFYALQTVSKLAKNLINI